MVVYQALKRIVHNVGVLAVLDGRNYDKNDGAMDIVSSDNSTSSSQDAARSKSYLTSKLFSTELIEDTGDRELCYLDPTLIESVFQKEITWLNEEPQSFEELAVVYPVVSELPEEDFP
jgi:hypothetical protein